MAGGIFIVSILLISTQSQPMWVQEVNSGSRVYALNHQVALLSISIPRLFSARRGGEDKLLREIEKSLPASKTKLTLSPWSWSWFISKMLEAQCIVTINHGALNRQTYQYAGWENIWTARPEGEGETEASSHEAGKGERTSHNPRTTSTELPSVITQMTRPASSLHTTTYHEGRSTETKYRFHRAKVQRVLPQLSALLVPPTDALLFPHTTMEGFRFTL